MESLRAWGARLTRVTILGVLTFFFAFPFLWMLIS